MGLFKIVEMTCFSIFILSHHSLAFISHGDCDDRTIKINFVRVCGAYPSLKRSAEPFHDPFMPSQDYYNSPDTVLYNFPQSMPYNSEVQSFMLPILSGNYQLPTWTNPPQPQSPIMQAIGPRSTQIYQQPPVNPNNFGFPQNNFPQNFQNQWAQPQTLPAIQDQRPLFQQEQSFNNPYNLPNVLSWLGNIDVYPLDPLTRSRRDRIKMEVNNFVKEECCSDKGCPFPEAYINLDKRINMCKRR